MKELSIEEKAKRYDEAIKVAKDSFNYPDYPGFIRADVAFPELKESEDERMVKFIKNQLFNIKKTITENYELDAKLTNAIDWLEKQGEQKHTDKVEPKFKVGDWIVFDNNVYYIGNIALKGYYECLRVDGTVHTFSLDIDSKSHLWTIQDAKDGDVLASKDGDDILIFRNVEDNVSFSSYYNIARKLEHYWSKSSFISATKEQRDQLEKAMTDAGYTFDFEKKELKKIEQKSVAKYKEWYDFIRWFVKQRTDDYTLIPSDDDIHKWGDNILNHAKKFLDKQNVAWSEEDEEIHRKCICAMRASACGFPEEEKFVEQVDNWFKCLKERYTWMPSDEMLEALYRVTPENVMEKSEDEILLDKLYQGLKYGKVLSEK